MGMRLLLSLVCFCSLTVALPASADAAVIAVRQDGTGDFTTVFDAVGTSTPGDTIEIGPGTYEPPGTIHVFHTLTFTSTDGPSATILDGTSAGHILRFRNGGLGCRVNSLTFTSAYVAGLGIAAIALVDGGQLTVTNSVFEGNTCAGITANHMSLLTVSDCVFRNNHLTGTGTGGVYVTGTAQGFVDNCTFENNSTPDAGAALWSVINASVTATGCTFRNNIAGLQGGAVHVGETGTGNFTGCLFVGNSAVGGAMYYFRSSGNVENNTFYGNTAVVGEVYGPSGTVLIHETSGVTLTKNIFANTASGYGVYLLFAGAVRSCNVYWSNDLGPVGGAALEPTSVVDDPIFCNVSADNFDVAFLGAAAPDNSPCGQLVGAFPASCEPPVTVAITAFRAVTKNAGISLDWDVFADEDFSGFSIFRASGGAPAIPIVDAPLSPDTRTFTDRAVVANTSYTYTLYALMPNGELIRSYPVTATTPSFTTSLLGAYPNPFNPSTTIRFSVSRATSVRIQVFDTRGRRIATLADRVFPAGAGEIGWNGHDAAGLRAASGVYFIRFQAADVTETRKLVLLK